MATVLGVLGVDTGYHPAAALVVDGRIVAFAEEERFTGNKGAVVDFPVRSVKWCLAEGGIDRDGIDLVAYGWDCERYSWEMPARVAAQVARSRLAQRGTSRPSVERSGGDAWIRGAMFLASHRPGWVTRRIAHGLRKAGYAGGMPPLRFFPHHRCHAASAFYCSGFDRAGVLVMDGSGEDVATTAWSGEGLSLTPQFSFQLPHSLGWFYSGFTEFLGFRHSLHEGKTMGLAAYGEPVDRWRELMRRIVRIDRDGGYRLDPSWGKFGRCSLGEHFSDRVVEHFGPPRVPESPIEQHHKDIAFAAQERLEEAICALVGRLTRETGQRRVCLAGGVAMNCKANGRLLDDGVADQLFVQPASDDSGAALGAALLGAVELGDDVRQRLRSAALGPAIDPDGARAVLNECGARYTEPRDLVERVADLIAGGSVVGWARGRLEIGARALGQRSILASATDPSMAERVNRTVKRREPWRPYAPSVTRAGARTMFGDEREDPFMLVARTVEEGVAAALPSVVHADGSSRPQTVDPEIQPVYHALIEAVGRRTGREVILNTSFNVRGQPLVLSPYDALGTFSSTGLDALAVGPFLVEKT